jgi:hypothetical protein
VLVLVRRGRHPALVDVPAGPAPAELGDDDGLADGLEGDESLGDDALGDEDLDDDDLAEGDLDGDEEEVLANEPLARTLVFLVLGFVVMVAGLAAVIAG